MAVQSGFFESEWDPELYNEETQSYGDWDRKYLAEQFARYFSKFTSTGVMNDEPNQLKVTAGSGMNVIVSPGFAFIKGFWLYNDELVSLSVPLNETPSTRYDSVRVRWNATTRRIELLYIADDIVNVRTDTYWDLQIAQIKVNPSSSSISSSDITDTRYDTELCGLIDIVKPEDVTELEATVTNIINGTTAVGNATHATNADSATNATNAASANSATTAGSVSNDFILRNKQALSFTNKVCTISDSRITADSLADVYFTNATMQAASKASITVETSAGAVTLTAAREPETILVASIRIRVV